MFTTVGPITNLAGAETGRRQGAKDPDPT